MRETSMLNDKAAKEIGDLQAAGMTVTPAEVVMLNDLAWAIETPYVRMHLARGVPVEVGGTLLWPQTLRAADWFSRVGSKLEGSSRQFALAYSMAFCYVDDFVYPEIDSAKKRVTKWRNGLSCTKKALFEAVRIVQEQEASPDMPEGPDGSPMTVGDFSAFLTATNGGSPEFWESRCSQDYSLATLSMIVRLKNSEGSSMVNDPVVKAELAFGYAVEKVRARNRGEVKDG